MWRWLLTFVSPQRYPLLMVLTLSLFAAVAGLGQPYLTKRLIDDGLLKGQYPVVVQTVAMVICLALGTAALGGVTRTLYVKTSACVLHALREDLFGHLLTLSPDFYARTRQGDIHQRLDADMAEVQRFIVDSLLSALNNTVILVGSVIMLGLMSLPLTALLVAVLIVNAVFLKIIRPMLENLTRKCRERGSDIASFFVETLASTRCIQTFNAADRECHRLSGLHWQQRKDMLAMQWASYAASSVPGLILSLATAAVLLLGSQQVLEHRGMTLGVLIAFITYMTKACGPAQSLLSLYVSFQRAKVSLMRISELAWEIPVVQQLPVVRQVSAQGPGHLEIKGITFKYRSAQAPVLSSFSLSVPPGSRVALRGASGAGKSTLADLLQRHFDPSQGTIELDGVDLRHLNLACIRKRIAVVSQDTQLFSCSVLDNIRYARPMAEDAEVKAAAKMAGVDEFVERLSDGWNTAVGQRGHALSGGQRQRIAIARALLLHPQVLILDESTCSVEVDQERRIHECIDQLFANSTRIFISHRPRDDAPFDLVVDLDRPSVLRVAS
ncbi:MULTISPECIES: ABC transporter ATP-binding protein [unclassified Pseudomonas]|uniref:ABC transporter ATP-binding protein n=1 Tax=unclassified Pseudomonas TaxID=196821 RepID=UPI001304E2AD|nr:MULTISPECIES: ABC transporter ATP-binding protein [unclassified Pseudomonas]